MIGRVRKHITSIKLNSFEAEIYTEEESLRIIIHKAYVAQSIIRIDAIDCRTTEIPFRSFTIIARGKVPDINPPVESRKRRKRSTGNSHSSG